MMKKLSEEQIAQIKHVCEFNMGGDFWSRIADLFTMVSGATEIDTDDLIVTVEGDDVVVSRLEEVSYEPSLVHEIVRIKM